ncbi:hypothetical protein EUGRSUZ_D00656 [Eucalyptus grandis]|uniref:Uncharacterized protein n=2 Tax=Eucalyptus grandis TaxID=71139 RepID=A0ACC3L3A7_EUCGR|nr:hypothetical protein EUGRSUZ_D00656 [Eucalyptus grandis]
METKIKLFLFILEFKLNKNYQNQNQSINIASSYLYFYEPDTTGASKDLLKSKSTLFQHQRNKHTLNAMKFTVHFIFKTPTT